MPIVILKQVSLKASLLIENPALPMLSAWQAVRRTFTSSLGNVLFERPIVGLLASLATKTIPKNVFLGVILL